MIGIAFAYQDATRLVVVELAKAEFRSLNHAAASIRKDMQASLQVAPGPSQPGKPPHAHKRKRGGKNIKQSILFAVDKQAELAVIGPSAQFVGDVGGVHERGGSRKADRFQPRPFAGPALERQLDRLPAGFAGSIGG